MEIPTSGFAHTLAQSSHVSHSVATFLGIIVSQKKKSVPELNDQPTYVLTVPYFGFSQYSCQTFKSYGTWHHADC